MADFWMAVAAGLAGALTFFAGLGGGLSLSRARDYPLALLGSIVHAPAYRLIDWIARRMAKHAAEVLATIKLTGGLLFFPATWILMMVAVGRTSGWTLGGATLVVLPISGYASLRFSERTSALIDRARALWILLTRRDTAAWLVSERAAIRATILELAARVETPEGVSVDGSEADASGS